MIPEKIGRYEIEKELGRGGMATVYQAHDPHFKREVAVKVLPSQLTHDPTFRARFAREAQTIAALEHPAIVPVYDYGEENEQPYLVMRLMSGGSLADQIKQGSLPMPEAAQIVNRLARALDYAHSQGVIHRDLKPGNILFDKQHNPYLADFGIAKLMEATTSFTGSAVVGTPAYMSPEQVKGGQKIDGRSDVYSLGIILYEMLTGRAPYQADTPIQVLMKHVLDPVPAIHDIKPDLPATVDSVVSRALAKDVTDRFSTAGELATAFSTTAGLNPPNLSGLSAQSTQSTQIKIPNWAWITLSIGGLVLLGWLFAPSISNLFTPETEVVVVTATTVPTTSTILPTITSTLTPLPPTKTATIIPSHTPTPPPTNTIIPSATPTPQPQVQIIRNGNLRSGPGTNYNSVGVISAGSIVVVLGKSVNEDWYFILLLDGNTAWIGASNVKVLDLGSIVLIPVITPGSETAVSFTRTPTPSPQTNTPIPEAPASTNTPRPNNPTNTPVNTPVPSATLLPTSTNDPYPGATNTVAPQPTNTSQPTNTPIPPTTTAVPIPTYTPLPQPTDTPRPSDTPVPPTFTPFVTSLPLP